MTAFNAEVDKFYDYAETGKVCPSSTSFCCNVGQAELWPAAEACVLACTKNKKSLNFASSGSWHLKVGIRTPENDFQIYRPINDPWHSVSSLGGDIGGGMSRNRFRAITFDWSVLQT